MFAHDQGPLNEYKYLGTVLDNKITFEIFDKNMKKLSILKHMLIILNNNKHFNSVVAVTKQ